MPRKRIIDPEFWSDQEIGQWSFEARLFYIGLWNFADDEGRLKAPLALLKAQIFPFETKINMDKVKKEVSAKIQWYSVNGSDYGFIRNFLKYQKIDRPTESKLPPPPQLDEDSSSTRGGLAANRIEEKIKEEKDPPREKPAKVRHLSFVWLLPVEYEKLKARCEGEDKAQKWIYDLNNYIGSKGDKYKSHYHTILNWIDMDVKKSTGN